MSLWNEFTKIIEFRFFVFKINGFDFIVSEINHIEFEQTHVANDPIKIYWNFNITCFAIKSFVTPPKSPANLGMLFRLRKAKADVDRQLKELVEAKTKEIATRAKALAETSVQLDEVAKVENAFELPFELHQI